MRIFDYLTRLFTVGVITLYGASLYFEKISAWFDAHALDLVRRSVATALLLGVSIILFSFSKPKGSLYSKLGNKMKLTARLFSYTLIVTCAFFTGLLVWQSLDMTDPWRIIVATVSGLVVFGFSSSYRLKDGDG